MVRSEAEPDIFLAKKLPVKLFRELLSEAREKELGFDRVGSDQCALEFGVAVNNRGRCGVSGPGPALTDFQNEFGLSIAKAFSGDGEELYPTRSSYLYYAVGDYSFFHHDTAASHITVIVGLTSTLLPLLMFPDFGPVSQTDVDKLNSISDVSFSAFPDGMRTKFGQRGTPVQVPVREGYAIAIPGRRVPHMRPAQIEKGAVCTACYSFLNPSRKWLIEKHDSP